MGVKFLMTLCIAFLLGDHGIGTTPSDLLCHLGKQMNKDLSSFGCPVDSIALFKNLLEKMEARTNKMTLENPLLTLLKNIGVKSNTVHSDATYQMAKLFNAGPVLGYSSRSDDVLRDFDPINRIAKTTSENFLQTLLKDIGNARETQNQIPVDALSMILNVPMQNSLTMKNLGIYGQTDPLAMARKVADIFRSQTPPSTQSNFASLLKVLDMENNNKPKAEMSTSNLQILATYQATLKPWETKFILEFVQLIPPSLESKLLPIVLDMIKNNKRPLDIGRSVVILLPETEKFRALQTITKYESNIGEKIKGMSSNSEMMNLLKWQGWRSVFDEDQEYEMFEDMASFMESSYGPNSFIWLHGLFNWMERETWPRNLLRRILGIVNKNENLKASLVENIMADKEISDFVYRVYLWMQTRNFSNSSYDIQMIHQFILSINFSRHYDNDQWLQGFSNWLDNNFRNLGAWSKIIKVVSKSMVDESWIFTLLKELMIDEKIEVRVIIQNGKSVCNRSLSTKRQSIENILLIAEGADNLCGQKNVKFFQRASLISKKQTGKRIFGINGISDSDNFKWVIYIKSQGGRILLKDVDVSYVPQNQEHIDIIYLRPSAVA